MTRIRTCPVRACVVVPEPAILAMKWRAATGGAAVITRSSARARKDATARAQVRLARDACVCAFVCARRGAGRGRVAVDANDGLTSRALPLLGAPFRTHRAASRRAMAGWKQKQAAKAKKKSKLDLVKRLTKLKIF